jgi:hypothetical protein
MKRITLALAAVALMACSSVVFAGRAPGPGHDVARVRAFSSVTYTETFRGGEQAIVSIRGDGTTDLDIFVYDEFGNLVAQGIGPTDRETVTWRPIWTGRFRIVIRNLGSVYNDYVLRTN